MIGDAFVVASSPELAREVAAMQTEPAPEAGTRVRADAAELLSELGAAFGADDSRRASAGRQRRGERLRRRRRHRRERRDHLEPADECRLMLP